MLLNQYPLLSLHVVFRMKDRDGEDIGHYVHVLCQESEIRNACLKALRMWKNQLDV